MKGTYKVGVLGLHMGKAWVRAAHENPYAQPAAVYDPLTDLCRSVAGEFGAKAPSSEGEFFKTDLDVIVVASPDPLHAPQSIRALSLGRHVICEKPLAGTVAECRRILRAVRRYDRAFMVGQVCRYAPGFRTAKALFDEGAIGRLACIESEYAHDYTLVPGVNGWRRDPEIRREGFIGGGCHALDIIRWFAGDPVEVFGYTNRMLLDGWPTDDTGEAVFRFRDGAIGRVFVSIGAKRPYTMRTVLYGTGGTLICSNHEPFIRLYREALHAKTGTKEFARIPVEQQSHNVSSELDEFIACLQEGKSPRTDAVEGAKTVLFGESALKSARTGRPVRISYRF